MSTSVTIRKWMIHLLQQVNEENKGQNCHFYLAPINPIKILLNFLPS